MTNDSNSITVADLKVMLAKLPDNAQLWVFDSGEFVFRPITNVVQDKRSNSLNFWIDTTP